MIGAVFFLTVFLGSTVSNTSLVYADGIEGDKCTPIYGGGVICPTPTCFPVYGGGVQCPKPPEVFLNKLVRNPSTGEYVDNLGPNDPKYRPDWEVLFRIIVKNSGDQALSNVTVSDRLPQFVEFVSGPGTYDSKTRMITLTLENLAGGASQTFEIKTKVVPVDQLPGDKSVACPVNVVDATSDREKDHDESQFCIEKEFVVPTVPQAGPGEWILSLGGLSALFGVGTYLRKRINIG